MLEELQRYTPDISIVRLVSVRSPFFVSGEKNAKQASDQQNCVLQEDPINFVSVTWLST